MRTQFLRACAAVMAIPFCSIAYAHPGHGIGVMAGMAHPLLGLDHVLAMLAVGVWAAQLGRSAKWLVPASFVLLMAVAACIGMAGVDLPVVEGGIATSVLLLGLLIAFSVNVNPSVAAGIVGVFAVFHGHAHGTEMSLQGAPWQFGVGFVVTTAVLHGLGVALGGRLHKQALGLRATGTLVAASGAFLMAANW